MKKIIIIAGIIIFTFILMGSKTLATSSLDNKLIYQQDTVSQETKDVEVIQEMNDINNSIKKRNQKTRNQNQKMDSILKSL